MRLKTTGTFTKLITALWTRALHTAPTTLVLLVFTIGALVVGLAACAEASGEPTPAAGERPTATLAAGATQPPPTASLAAGGTPTPTAGALPGLTVNPSVFDELPGPLPVSQKSQAEASAFLAKKVNAGGPDSLAALVAALKASGIAVRGRSGNLLVEPDRPWQGIALDAWEVHALNVLVQRDQTVYIALPDLAETLTEAAPELQGAPVEQLLIDGLRAHAQGPVSPMRFWAQFIIALGREAPAPDSVDLLGDEDAGAVRLNGVQASLIVRRFSLDLLMLAGEGESASAPPTRWKWLAPRPAYADTLPCSLSGTEKTIMDIAALGTKLALGGFSLSDGPGFDGLLKWLEKQGVTGTEAFKKWTGHASLALAYAKFIYTYAALDVTVNMDAPGPPLVRTKEERPRSGEQRTLTGQVKLNVGNAQLFNCFRIMLNSAGLDFTVPGDGPVKDARVAWVGVSGFSEAAEVLHGGPEQMVRFYADPSTRVQGGGDPSSGLNPITNQLTDAKGTARVGVEGVGQNEDLGADVEPVMERAELMVNVGLKGADIVKDLGDAAKAALSKEKLLLTLPLELLYRAKWASAGHYALQVKDWEVPARGWAGTIEYTETVEMEESRPQGPDLTIVDRKDSTFTQTFKLGILTNMDSMGTAWMDGTVKAQYEGVDMNERKVVYNDRCDPSHEIFIWQDGSAYTQRTLAGTLTAEAAIIVSRDPSGDYKIKAWSNRPLQAKGESTMTTERYCGSRREPHETKTEISQTFSIRMEALAPIDPEHPDELTGSMTVESPKEHKTTTITWDLTRVRGTQ